MTYVSTLSPDAVKPKKKHLGILDALRGFAALSVVLFHFTGGALPKLADPSFDYLFSWGYMGVEVFFVISGFVIPYSLWNTDYSATKIIPYLRKRVLRICPPAYLSLVLLLLQWFIVDYLLHHDNSRLGAVTSRQVFDNFTFLAPFTGSKWLNAVFWTLAIEFQFYLVIGLLYRALFQSKVTTFLLLSLILDGIQYLPYLPGDNFFRYSLFFALGGAVLLLQQQRITVLVFLLLITLFTGLLVYHISLWPALFGAVTALLIAFATVDNLISRWLGNISYSLYLTHFMAGAAAEFILTKLLPPTSRLLIAIEILGCILAALAFAYLFYRFVEKPFHKLAQLVGK